MLGGIKRKCYLKLVAALVRLIKLAQRVERNAGRAIVYLASR
jgi:hypothetical protein